MNISFLLSQFHHHGLIEKFADAHILAHSLQIQQKTQHIMPRYGISSTVCEISIVAMHWRETFVEVQKRNKNVFDALFWTKVKENTIDQKKNITHIFAGSREVKKEK